jgi:Uma2 family endonuclease
MQPIMPRVPLDHPATYDDLVKLPDIVVAEIVNGELHASPRPAPAHAIAGTELGGVLTPAYSRGRGGPGGWWILFEPELHLGPDVLVPDLAGWRRTRMPQRPATAYFPLAPDWICEVLSPTTARLDRAQKLSIYAREGIPHAWMLDPLALTLEVLRLDDGRWTIVGVHAGDAVVHAEPFVEINLNLAVLWSEPPAAPQPAR